jgi:type II secretory pathway pseudopilin PulG
VEAVVALAIMGIVMALSVGGRSLIDNRRLVGAARTLATDMRWVEQRARTERLCWRVEFDPAPLPAGEHYHIQFLDGGSWTPAGGCTGGTWTDYTPPAGRTFPRGIDLESTTFGGDRMTVSPFGNPNAGAVTLRTSRGEPRVVTVNVIGRITITR